MERGGGTTLQNALRVAAAFELSVYEVWEIQDSDSKNKKGVNRDTRTVHELRTQRGWRLYDMASVSGVSMSTVASVEKGRFPTLKNAVRIAAAFGVSVHEIWRLGVKGDDQGLIQ